MNETPIASRPERKPRLEIFVDGTNFHLACRSAGIAYVIDIPFLARQLARTGNGYVLVKMRYYTAPSPHSGTPEYKNQQRFFDELRRARNIELILGRHEPRFDGGRKYHVEKETDVNLAVDMVVGAYEHRYDVAMLISGDTDYVRAIKAVQAVGKRVIWCRLPNQRHSDALAHVCDGQFELTEKFLRTCRKYHR